MVRSVMAQSQPRERCVGEQHTATRSDKCLRGGAACVAALLWADLFDSAQLISVLGVHTAP